VGFAEELLTVLFIPTRKHPAIGQEAIFLKEEWQTPYALVKNPNSAKISLRYTAFTANFI
jgi:hypothetical protein